MMFSVFVFAPLLVSKANIFFFNIAFVWGRTHLNHYDILATVMSPIQRHKLEVDDMFEEKTTLFTRTLPQSD